MLSSGRTAETVISGAAAINSRHGAFEPADRLAFRILLDRGLELLDRQQRRRDDRSGNAAAARARAFPQVRIADVNLDLVRLQPEFTRDRIGDHGAAAGADILDRGAGDDASILHRQLDLGAGLPEIEPIAGGDADAAAIAAGLRCRRLARCARFRVRMPNRKAAGDWDWGPSVCARRSDQPSSATRLRRSPVPAQTPSADRRGRGRRAGRQVADDVVIGELLGFRRIDQPGKRGERRVDGSAGVGMGRERQRLEIALRGRQQRELDFRRRPIAGDGKFLVPVKGDPAPAPSPRARDRSRLWSRCQSCPWSRSRRRHGRRSRAPCRVRACSAWRSAP